MGAAKRDEIMKKTLADALAKQGYETLTPVQIAVSDEKYDNADLLVSAQTGSGKTVGFGLAIGTTILDDDGRLPRAAAPLAIIIAPTRELAMRINVAVRRCRCHNGILCGRYGYAR